MAKLTAPLMSLGARGTIGKAITFSAWKGVDYARQRVIPANPKTAAQSETRNTFKTLNEMFKIMGTLAKAPWASAATGQPFTDRNRFIQANLPALKGDADMTAFQGSPGSLAGLPPVSVVAAQNVGDIDIVVTPPAVPVGWTVQDVVAIAFKDQDPALAFASAVGEGLDTAAPWTVSLPHGGGTGQWITSGWVRFVRPDTRIAYGASLQDPVTIV